MRFAYIDSNGNEVPIPSVDALALRIELGAIADETQLYDAQADLWAPANSHEIYHTLSRDSGGDAGFVPAPVAPPPSSATPVEAPEEPVVEAADLQPEPEPAEPEAAAEDALEPAEPDEDSGLTLAGDPPVGDTELEAAEASEVLESSEDLGVGTLDLAPADESSATPSAEPLDLSSPMDEPDSGEEADAGPTFDFGGMEGGLEVEAIDGPEEVAEAMDFSAAIPESELAEPQAPDFSGGMELETAAEFDAGGLDMGGGGTLELETPMSEFSPDAPPGWMEEGPDAGDAEEVMDLSSVGARTDEVEADVTGPSDQRVPKNKPSKPKFKRQRNLAGPIVGVMLLLVVGIGGYAAWPAISARFAGEAEDTGTVIPSIPSALEAQMRSIAEVAIAAAYEDVRSAWASSGAVNDPGPNWLSGRYLATASEYAEAEAFWEGMSDLMVDADDIDLAAFDAAYQAELQRQSVSEADGALMRARADSGFVAASVARTAVHQGVEDLINAALRLHGFLVANEANITYAPASSATTDPVFEADPATPELRASMEGMIDEVTSALSDLDYRNQITAAALWASLVANVQETGIQ